MQFQVPQFIDTEDKIVGPLSIRQFIYIVIALAVSTILYFTVQAWLWIILSIPIVGLGAAMAFIKVNGRPFSKILLASLSFYWKPQTYVWQPEQPHQPKTVETLKEAAGERFSIEKVLAGMALKKVWGTVQTGSAPAPVERPKPAPDERYEVFQNITGENRAARRIDYR